MHNTPVLRGKNCFWPPSLFLGGLDLGENKIGELCFWTMVNFDFFLLFQAITWPIYKPTRFMSDIRNGFAYMAALISLQNRPVVFACALSYSFVFFFSSGSRQWPFILGRFILLPRTFLVVYICPTKAGRCHSTRTFYGKNHWFFIPIRNLSLLPVSCSLIADTYVANFWN